MVSTDRAYFDEMYRSDPDPWQFESSWYEGRKYALTVAALPDRRYRSAFEPGCSVGVLSSLLAERCEQLLATDIVPGVLDRARRHVPDTERVRFEVRAIPEQWPSGPFDLVVLSEIAYYFDAADLARVIALVMKSTEIGAQVLGVHWRGTTNYPLSGDGAHGIIDAAPGLEQVVHHVEKDFLLDVWERRA
jgi:SAM-dependent methyltransferase